MLPPGHIAAGYLTAQAAIKIFHPNFSQQEIHALYVWGMFWGFSPDLDMFYAFFKSRSFTTNLNKVNHRKFVSHAPIVWLLAGCIFYFVAQSAFWKFNALLMVLGSFSHFILDSIEYGIPWLWPFSHRLFAFIKPDTLTFAPEPKNFLKYWTSFIKFYLTRPSFYLEILIIIIAIIYV